jgi:hypothetical protein
MKIGILTFHWSNNYGALLQTYCLSETIRAMGHDVSVIDYLPLGHGIRWWQGWGIHCGTPMLAMKRLRIDRFRRQYIPLTNRCRNIDQLACLAREFDAIIVGSDQVWNGNIIGARELPYFLGFADSERSRLISYAATFGEPDQPQHTISLAGPMLRRFHSLSVRDEMSALLVRQLSGEEAEIVVDPTLLFDFRKLPEFRVPHRDYIATYHISDKHAGLGREVLREVWSSLQMPAVADGQSADAVKADSQVLSAGPLEWLRIIQGASFVCTDSFHAVALAIAFAKPLIAWAGIRQSRIRSLLSVCGLENRFVKTADPTVIRRILKTPIDYQAVSRRLTPHVAFSRAFLEQALAHGSGCTEGVTAIAKSGRPRT